MKIFIVIIGLILVGNDYTYSQYFVSGTDNPKLKWFLVQNNQLSVIYPADYDSIALYVAKGVSENLSVSKSEFSTKILKVKIILHPFSVLSNGWVAWAPKRTEYILIPPQEILPQPWIDQLVIHETRHWLQFNCLHQKLRPYTWCLGEQITGLITGLQMPKWFLEGDAVCAETKYSNSGRGRSSSFLFELNAMLAEKGKYSYHKMCFGSYKDFTPDYYQFGYQICSYLYLKYPRLSSSVINDIGENPFAVRAFYSAVRKHTKLPFNKLYDNILDSVITSGWSYYADSLTKAIVVSNNNEYCNYHHIHVTPDNKIIALKKSFSNIPAIISIDDSGFEYIITYPGYQAETFFSASQQYLAWSEISIGRHQHDNYNDIYLFNIETSAKRRLTYHQKYFSPSLSPDGNFLAAVRFDEKNNCYLDIIDCKTAAIKYSCKANNNTSFHHPLFSTDGKSVLLIAVDRQGKSIIKFSYHDNTLCTLFCSGFDDIDYPLLTGDTLYFIADYNNRRNVFACDTTTKKLFQITNLCYGTNSFSFSPDLIKLYLTNYTANGYRIEHISNSYRKPVDYIGNDFKIASKLAEQRTDSIINTDALPFTIGSYSKINHLFNFHSWNPVVLGYDLDNLVTVKGIAFLSQNDLSSAVTSIKYYFINDKVSVFDASFEYLGWFPVIGFNVRSQHVWNEFLSVSPKFYYAKIYNTFPIIWNKDTYIKRFEIQTSLELAAHTIKVEGKMNYLFPQIDFRFVNRKMTSKKQLFPKWGQIIHFTYKRDIMFNGNGNAFLTSASFYIPGLFKYDGLNISATYFRHYRNDNLEVFPDVIYPRGYNKSLNKKFTSIYLNYSLPLFYPDLSIHGVLYIKRIKTCLFSDLANLNTTTNKFDFFSAGFDLTTDCHFFHWIFPFETGLRVGFIPANNKVFTNFLIKVNIDY